MAFDGPSPHLADLPDDEPWQPKDYFIPSVVHRMDWGAVQGRSRTSTTHPMKYVVYTAETEFQPCRNKEECSAEVRRMQKHYMDKGYDDIPYNFIIGNDGNVYEGRGWLFQPGPQGFDVNKVLKKSSSILDIGVICGHNEIIPEKMDMVRDAFKLADKLVDFGLLKKMIAESHELIFSDEITDNNPAALK